MPKFIGKQYTKPANQMAVSAQFKMLSIEHLQNLSYEQLQRLSVPEYQYRANKIQSYKKTLQSD